MSTDQKPSPDQDPIDIPEAMGFLGEAGKQMLESSSSVSEVLTRLRDFAPSIGLRGVDIDATLSSLTISYWHHGRREPLTLMKEISISNPRLERLAVAEALLNGIERGTIKFDEAYDRLRQLQAKPDPSGWLPSIAILVSVAGWVVFVGGTNVQTIAVALLATLVILPVNVVTTRLGLPSIAGVFVSAVLLAAVPNLVAAAGLPIQVGPAVVGTLFIYLPGRQLVSSVVDGLANAPLSAISRGLQALVTAGALAVGMLLGSTIGAGLGLKFQPAGTDSPLWATLIGATLGMLGLAYAWSLPRRQLIPTLIIGIIGWLTVWATAQIDTGPTWTGTFIAAGLIGISGIVAAAIQSSSPSVYTGVAILPLVPGLILYRAMLALSEGRTDAAIGFLLDATVLSLAIAVGIAVGLALGKDGGRAIRRIRRT